MAKAKSRQACGSGSGLGASLRFSEKPLDINLVRASHLDFERPTWLQTGFGRLEAEAG